MLTICIVAIQALRCYFPYLTLIPKAVLKQADEDNSMVKMHFD